MHKSGIFSGAPACVSAALHFWVDVAVAENRDVVVGARRPPRLIHGNQTKIKGRAAEAPTCSSSFTFKASTWDPHFSSSSAWASYPWVKIHTELNQFLQLFILGTALKCHECGTTGQCTDADKPAEKECGTGMDSCLYYTGSKSIQFWLLQSYNFLF